MFLVLPYRPMNLPRFRDVPALCCARGIRQFFLLVLALALFGNSQLKQKKNFMQATVISQRLEMYFPT